MAIQVTIQRNCRFCKRTFDALIGNVKQGKGWYCSKTCSNRGNGLKFPKGHKGYLTPEIYKANGAKISKSKKGISFSKKHKEALVKARIEFYKKHGYKKCKTRIRKCHKCYEWRKSVFERDHYTCQMCGIYGVYLEADHIKAWSKYPKLRHEISNGRTLCKPCHIKTSNYKSKAKIYNG